MKINAIAQVCMWLPGFAPEEDPLVVLGPLSSAMEAAQQDSTKPVPATLWPVLEATHHASVTTSVPKYDANIAAIRLLRKLETEGRGADEQEQGLLNLYTGWGGLVKALDGATSDTAWAARHEEVKSLLTPAEFESASLSSLNAYYTPVMVVEAMWSAVQRLGFDGGNVLDPCTGVGYFLGAMPQELARKSRITAVEVDSLSARMAKAMYSQYGVRVIESEVEKANLPAGGYDLVIGNIPFGAEKSAELRNVPFANYSLHNYFIAKSLELVRPGGLVAVVTSTGTMDSWTSGHRAYLSSEAKLVEAIRLPRDTFKEIASTSVTTDLLIFQKRVCKAPDANEPQWLESRVLERSSPICGDWNNRISVNGYFAAHPRSVIGKLKGVTSQHGMSVVCDFTGDLKAALMERVNELPEGIYKPRAVKAANQGKKVAEITLEERRRPGLVIIDGKVYEVDGDKAKPYGKAGKSLDRLVSMIEVRDSLRSLIAAQTATHNEDVLARLRISLNITYDKHVLAFGPVNATANRRAFSVDPDLPLLLSIEDWNAETETATKAPIFERNTMGVTKRVDRCESVEEALQVVLGESGRVVPTRIAELVRKDEQVAMQELAALELVYLDPETMNWDSADSYLSGNVRRKLQLAELAGDEYERNVKALQSVMPRQLERGEINARLGSTWIPARFYVQFMDETFKCSHNEVQFDERVGAWTVKASHSMSYGVLATQTFGTSRVDAATLLELELNQRKPTIYDKTIDGSRVVNPRETVVAREKQHQLKEAFVHWLWSEEKRAETLAAQYNLLYRSVVVRKFDGKHLVLPGMSNAYTLRSHQRDAVWRVISSRYNTLLAHAVGAGKTLEMICAGMELKRLGLAKKTMYVVPNHMLLQFAGDFLKAYPHAKVLAASKDDLSGDKRRLMLSRIAVHDWDAVIVTHSTFEGIKISDDYMKSFIEEELDVIETAIREFGSSGRGSIVKELARAKKAWKVRLEKKSKQSEKDDMLTFEDLGIDQLAYDEIHVAKNLYKFTKMDRIAGLPNSNSQRAFDVFVKTQYVMRKRGDGKGLIGATATPISNSTAEIWTMMRFMQPQMLEEFGVQHFDSWAANFGETVTALELAPDGAGYRMMSRFSRYINVPELMSMFRLVADVRTSEMLDLPVPTPVMETVSVEPSQDLRDYVAVLVKRAEKIRNGGVKPSDDNMLKVTGDGRRAALDVRLVGLPAPADKSGKLYECARKVHSIWEQYAESKAAQIIFCDLSTPSATGGFTAYNEVRSELIELGVPADEIAFIHDYETDVRKEELFQAVRLGTIRVLMGSTSKLGMGTNVQDRLIALHHLDLPWRTSDMEQRVGRIVRQGNMFSKVFIFTYLTSASFDAYIAQLLVTKAKFIAQVMVGNDEIRTMEDVEAATLSYAEMVAIASGNPLVLERAGVDAELTKLAVLRQSWERQQMSNAREIKALPDWIKSASDAVSNIKADMAMVKNYEFAGGTGMKVFGKAQQCVSDAVHAVGAAMINAPIGWSVIGSFMGLSVSIQRSGEDNYSVRLQGSHTYDAAGASKPQAVLTHAQHVVDDLAATLESKIARVAYFKKQLVDLQVEVTKPFDQQERFVALRKRQFEIEAELEITTGDMAAMDETEQSEETAAA
ncbi:DEAD/DEAH box helicase family protein [Acidovorax sp. LjRoot129]|uniref:DEAD/DEAH box helicase family protein n=1 Tax=unclassified Acidovorax TaxID=2684926 RepID=UPI003ECDF0C3